MPADVGELPRPGAFVVRAGDDVVVIARRRVEEADALGARPVRRRARGARRRPRLHRPARERLGRRDGRHLRGRQVGLGRVDRRGPAGVVDDGEAGSGQEPTRLATGQRRLEQALDRGAAVQRQVGDVVLVAQDRVAQRSPAAAVLHERVELGVGPRAEVRRVGQRVGVAAVVGRHEGVELALRAGGCPARTARRLRSPPRRGCSETSSTTGCRSGRGCRRRCSRRSRCPR